MKYYRIRDEINYKNRWFLGPVISDEEFDHWKYTTASVVLKPSESILIKVKEAGISLDFTFGEFDILIVNEVCSKLFENNLIQLIPVKIEHTNSNHYLLIIKNEVDCIDESRSEFTKFEPNDPVRPDKAGQYRNFHKLIIDPAKVQPSVFRIKNYDIAIIVNSEFKTKFEELNMTGIKFTPVTK